MHIKDSVIVQALELCIKSGPESQAAPYKVNRRAQLDMTKTKRTISTDQLRMTLPPCESVLHFYLVLVAEILMT